VKGLIFTYALTYGGALASLADAEYVLLGIPDVHGSIRGKALRPAGPAAGAGDAGTSRRASFSSRRRRAESRRQGGNNQQRGGDDQHQDGHQTLHDEVSILHVIGLIENARHVGEKPRAR